MGNYGSKINPEILGSSFQASSSSRKRLRIEEEDKGDKGLLRFKEESFSSRELEVLEKIDFVADETLTSSVNDSTKDSTELANLTAVIQNHLTCCSCGGLPRSRPLMMCTSGHVSCASCYHVSRSLLQCTQPGCQLHAAEHPSSALALSLLSTITRPCAWAAHGCGHRGPLMEVETHEPSCVFQEVECWVCGSSPSLANFHNHSPDLRCFQERTIRNYDEVKTSISMSVSSCRHPPVAVLYQDSLFFIRISHIKSRSVWIASVAGQMINEDCRRFLVCLDLTSPHDKFGPSFSFSGPPCSLTASVEEVLKAGNCLVLTDPALSNITGGRTKQRNLSVTLRIDVLKS